MPFNYAIAFWVMLSFYVVTFLTSLILYLMKRNKTKKIGALVSAMRKSLREHHRDQSKLFNMLDSFLKDTPDFFLRMPKPRYKREDDWEEYGG